MLRYKTQNPIYARISLISFDGELILTVPDDNTARGRNAAIPDPFRLFKSAVDNSFTSGVQLDHPEGPLLLFSKRVFDFEDSLKPVGHLVFYVKLVSLTKYIEELTPVPGTVGFVYDHGLEQVIGSAALSRNLKEIIAREAVKTVAEKSSQLGENRFYWARVADLNWTIGLVMPEQALLGSITKLKFSSLAFSVAVAVMALLITFYSGAADYRSHRPVDAWRPGIQYRESGSPHHYSGRGRTAQAGRRIQCNGWPPQSP